MTSGPPPSGLQWVLRPARPKVHRPVTWESAPARRRRSTTAPARPPEPAPTARADGRPAMAEAPSPPRPAHPRRTGRSPAGGENGPASPAERSPLRSPVNWPVFIGTAVLIVGFVLFAGIWPGTAEDVIFGSMAWVATNFGWYYVLTATI